MLGVADLLVPELTVTGGGLASALVGLTGVVVTRSGWLAPRGMSFGLAAIPLVGGIWTIGLQDGAAWAELLAVPASTALVGASVSLRSSQLLVVGALGLFLTVTTGVMRHFADTVGVPVALLVVGGMLIGSAVLVGRLRPMTRGDA